MSLTVEATYENGVLKPVQALPLKEHQRVQVTVHSPAPDIVQAYRIMGWKGDAETLRRIALDPEFLAEVYAKRPFGGAQQVFRYLGRYSHRVAIANSRLLALDDGQVSFSWKDYADDQRTKVMRLTADEFIRRFLLHVLPKRFVRIRHYGLLAGRHAAQWTRCRQLLGVPDVEPPVERIWLDRLREWTGQDLSCCPQCQGPLTRQPLEATTTAPAPAPQRRDAWCGVDSS